MNEIKKIPVQDLGYHFIPEQYLPEGEDEYYLRNLQNRSGIDYRNLTANEIEQLVRNRNSSDNWNNILVSENFNPELVKNCKFFGLVRIGKLEPLYLEFHAVRLPVGIYNSTIISCDFGDNVVIDNVNYLSHYIIGNEVIVVNVNEMANTNYSKFGNGILKDGETEKIRIWMELCNENGGRNVLPFSGMLPGDAYLWTRNRTDKKLLDKFKYFTQNQLDTKRGYYGKVGDRSVIKNCKILKDVWVGSDAYLKGANKIKNVTINSDATRKSQIGEGCEIVNGIIGYGCRLFYGVKAVRFVMAAHSQLKYGARLINSYLGSNATISCCEVLNSLIFSAHEQHHNNSFLCAALVMGQSNIAAGATIGSNHNSRAADGEVIAKRGFWPGLCVSLKHNSQFASFTMIAKGDYPHELNSALPFSLISNEEHSNSLIIMPAYWFMYNMYALARNAGKYAERDQRKFKIQLIDYNYLAPDTINEILVAIETLALETAKALLLQQNNTTTKTKKALIEIGKKTLQNKKLVDSLFIVSTNTENSKRTVKLIKVYEAYHTYQKMLNLYVYETLLDYIQNKELHTISKIKQALVNNVPIHEWENVGGQLIEKKQVQQLKKDIKAGLVNSWDDIRTFYKAEGVQYEFNKLQHALACSTLIENYSLKTISKINIHKTIDYLIVAKKELYEKIYESRAKDYTDPYKQMVYENEKEMETVIGRLEDNTFIQQQQKAIVAYTKKLNLYRKQIK
jgi:signal peptidase I